VRLFVGVPIGGAAADAIGAIRKTLVSRMVQLDPHARVTWVEADRLHVTVRFIGEVDGAAASAIEAALQPPLAVSPFTLRLRGIGRFPGGGRPRGLWVDVEDGADQMRAIEHEVSERLLRACGLPGEERRYTPHATIARVRGASGGRLRMLVEGLEAAPLGATRVEAITLFESRLSSQGATYVALQRTPLGGPA
jgi:2'-5' RNA ligase